MESLEQLEQDAVDAAIDADWKKAVDLNIRIIAADEENIAAHLRAGYAYLQQNSLEQARKQFRKVLKIQPKNNIAEEHLEKIAVLLEKKKKRHATATRINPDVFIDIPGKTRTVHLVKLGQKEDLAGINIGEEVLLKEKRRKLEVRTKEDEYLGSLPDDISKRLTYFINEGSIYSTHIKEIDLSSVVIFIREISKGKKVKRYPSFPSNPHVMLSDIHQLESSEEDDQKTDSEDDEDGDVEGDLGLDDDAWEEYEEEKDFSTIVQLEDEDEEEEE